MTLKGLIQCFIFFVVLGFQYSVFAQSYDQLSKQSLQFYDKGDFKKSIQLAQQQLSTAEKESGRESIKYALSLNNLGRSYKAAGEYKKPKPMYLNALEIQKRQLGESHPDYATTLSNLAELYEALGDYQSSLPLFNQALSIRKKVFGEEHPQYAKSLQDLGILYQYTGEITKSGDILDVALGIQARTTGNLDRDFAVSLEQRGVTFANANDLPHADSLITLALEIRRKILGDSHPDYAESLSDLGIIRQLQGEYPESEKLLTQALETKHKTLGDKHPSCAYTLQWLGRLYRFMAEYAKAYSLLSEAVNIQKVTIGENHSDYSMSIAELGRVCFLMANYDQAELLFIESTEIRKRRGLGPDHPDYPSSLNDLAMFYQNRGSYEKALVLYKQVVEQFTANVRRTAIENLGSLYYDLGDYSNAEHFLLLGVKELRDEGESGIAYATALDNLGVFYSTIGNSGKARPLLAQALKMRKNQLGEAHPDYATSLKNLASSYKEDGEFAKAEQLYNQVLAIDKMSLGEGHPDYAYVLIRLADLYVEMGDNAKAELFYQQAIQILKLAFGESHPAYATSLDALGSFYIQIGNYEKGKTFYEQAIEIRRTALGENHPDYATSLSHLAAISADFGEYRKAESLYLQAFKIDSLSLPSKKYRDPVLLNNLALLYETIEEFDKAQLLFTEGLQITKQLHGENNLNYAAGLQNAGGLYAKMNQHKKAEEMLIQSLEVQKKVLGEKNYTNASTLNELADLYEKLNNLQKSEGAYEKATTILLQTLTNNFRFLSEQEKSKFSTNILFYFNKCMSFYIRHQKQNPSLAGKGYDIALATKGMILNTAIEMRNIISEDSASIQLYDQWLTLSATIAKQSALPIPERTQNVDELEARASQFEKQLTRISAKFKGAAYSMNSHWEDIQYKLREGEAYIEFTSFNYFNGKKWTDSVMYSAFVLRKEDKYPFMVPLFEARQLDNLLVNSSNTQQAFVAGLYRGIEVTAKGERVAYGQKLYELIWNPLSVYLKQNDHIYFAPAGRLHQIAMAAIPFGDEKLLSDQYQLTQLMSTSVQEQGSKTKQSLLNSMAVFGGVEYSGDFIEQTGSSQENSTIPPSFLSLPRDAGHGESWNNLPGTLTEGKALSELARKKKLSCIFYSGNLAREEKLKELAGKRSPSVLHIATHGFFFEDPGKEKDTVSRTRQNFFRYSDNPMYRAGLLFASANRTWRGESIPPNVEDGILTAAEVKSIILPNTELVVLSACETALGEIEHNEGVFGMQRAFKIAGANYMLMSLWKVPDKETTEFMLFFYNRWFEGSTIDSSFLKTQQFMKRKYPNEPFKWAAFILVR